MTSRSMCQRALCFQECGWLSSTQLFCECNLRWGQECPSFAEARSASCTRRQLHHHDGLVAVGLAGGYPKIQDWIDFAKEENRTKASVR